MSRSVFKTRKEAALHNRAQRATRADKPEELRVILSDHKAKKLLSEPGGKVLDYLLNDAIGFGRFECIQELIKAGANPNCRGHCSHVRDAIREGGDIGILRLLLDNGADFDSDFAPHSDLPLYFSASFADLRCFRQLLLYGADPDYNCSHRDFLTTTPDAESVLGMCLANNYELPFVKLLIQFGANMYLPDIQKILIQTENDATKLLNREKAHPRSLMSQCRIKIRRLLKQEGKLCLIDQLEIPQDLVRYLQYHRELDYPEQPARYQEEYTMFHSCP